MKWRVSCEIANSFTFFDLLVDADTEEHAKATQDLSYLNALLPKNAQIVVRDAQPLNIGPG